jgi:hypothetical protein
MPSDVQRFAEGKVIEESMTGYRSPGYAFVSRWKLITYVYPLLLLLDLTP